MANALSRETSPYLRQHADNPVDWYPWGEEALALARASGKPILLSIGYSACHWCHVMAHESFEDPVTARLMNELFVNVKVDREERPDLDRIYQIAQQMLTQRGGGWPLTMFLAHDDQRPFFGGTYFPPTARFGMPAFRDLLARVAEYYRDHREDLRKQSDALLEAFATLESAPADSATTLTDAPLVAFRGQIERSFDRTRGGFGDAPKFPHPTSIERLMRAWHATAKSPEPDLHALFMATLTLTRMAEGGLFDHVAGGFYRYSVDADWMIPHFEKMLYDNGALLASYAGATVATGEALFARTAAQTATWLLADMQSPEGGFYSSRDADSEGHEGRYYVWTPAEAQSLLGADEYAVLAARFGLDRAPNFEGAWHLHAFRGIEEIAAERGEAPSAVVTRIDSARARLLAARERRVPPARDEKILTSWNAIAIRGLAIAARALDEPRLADAATRALDFLRERLWRNGRLLATYKDGRAHLNAYLDDYALLADAILELLQARWRSEDLALARALLEAMLEHFEDRDAGGFWFTSHDHERLMHRSKSFSDDATPCGNGVAATVLQRMGYLLGEPRWLAAAERTLRAGWSGLSRQPQAHASMLTALEEYLAPPQIVILRGDPAGISRWQRELARLYAPQRITLAIADDATGLPAALADKSAHGGVVAYLCRGSTCSAPIDDLSVLLRDLRLALSP
ncbi:MAG TPA: thioredoxin domain-containing protein [Steroidobacteraceae bacterium]|nr:thioredoxin domain-containing protein [Steroidobacteraceae bacterium]HQW09593.1 thioredoxin domain-containing protein [Steroidobacteraceae bacterium]HQX78058.1 thioredoxin domain-containing protein [Steroidobacteraceae bacterium]